MTTTSQTQALAQALALAQKRVGHYHAAATLLHGLPCGGWGETDQAERQLQELLPGHWERAYTLDEWIAATHDDVGGRYQSRFR